MRFLELPKSKKPRQHRFLVQKAIGGCQAEDMHYSPLEDTGGQVIQSVPPLVGQPVMAYR